MAVGVTGSQAWSVHTETTLQKGEQTELGATRCASTAREARSQPRQGHRQLHRVRARRRDCGPAKKFYPQEQSPIAYVDYRLASSRPLPVLAFARDGSTPP